MHREQGQTALEYAVLVAALTLTMCTLLVGFGSGVMDDALARIEAMMPF